MSPAGWHTCGVLALLGQSGDLAAGRRHHAKEKRDTSAKKPDWEDRTQVETVEKSRNERIKKKKTLSKISKKKREG